MRTIGIICEYNPFHYGHQYLIEQAKKHGDGQFIVCVLSSNFLQRGVPSLINKYDRAKMAILGGADLVIEIPSIFSCRNAKEYAYHAVSLLHKLGICDTLIFGSESGDVKMLSDIADILIKEPESYRIILKEFLQLGLSYPKARANALSAFLDNPLIDELVKSSNNILAIEYIIAIKQLQSPINYETIKRQGASYLDESLSKSFSSATAIRKSINSNSLSSIKEQVPKSSYKILENNNFVFPNQLSQLINYKLASLTKNELQTYLNVTEGLENRLKEGASKHLTFTELVDFVSSKRYPKTRIQRILIHILLGFTHDILLQDISYARLLYVSKHGEKLFSILHKNTLIPVFTSFNQFYKIAPTKIKKLLDLELKASNIYESLSGGTLNSEYTHKFETI